MTVPKINSAHGSDTRNIINRVIEVLNQQGKSLQDLVAEGQLTEEQYAELLTTINSLVKSGNVDKSDLTPEFKSEIEGFNTQLAEKATKTDVGLEKIKSMGVAFGEIKIPSDFRSVPFKIYRTSDGIVKHDFDFDSLKTGNKIYVNRDTGDDSTGDGTQGNPFKTLRNAITNAISLGGDNVIVCQTYRFDRNETIANQTSSGHTINGGRLSIIPEDENEKIIITSADERLTWTDVGSGTWKTARSEVANVFDLRERDFHGVPIPFDHKDSVSECQSSPMSWYTDSVDLYIHTKDGEMPDHTNVIANLYLTCFNFDLLNDSTLYIENTEIYGGSTSASNIEIKGATDGSVGSTFIAKNTISVGGIVGKNHRWLPSENNTATRNVKNTYLFDCKSPYAPRDGFNYHYLDIPIEQRRNCLVVEYNCVSYENGMNDYSNGNNNCFTVHGGVCALHMNGVGYKSTGPILHNITGCYTICIDCSMGYSLAEWVDGTAYCAFSFQDPASKAVLINCNAHGDHNHLYASEGAGLYVQKMNLYNIMYNVQPTPFTQEIPVV